jgi:hypothetical protein
MYRIGRIIGHIGRIGHIPALVRLGLRISDKAWKFRYT